MSVIWIMARAVAAAQAAGSIQADGGAKQRVREKYEEDPMMPMRAAELVAIEFQVIAEANDYWRDRGAGAD